jgi:formylglycine-generating enzyme required for sulfatase activity
VREFHRQGVRVFLPYNPWDTGTARAQESDDSALARLVGATEADGLFLDTMLAAPTGLRQSIDAVRPGVAFEPEGHPSIEEMQQCNASWAQGLQAYPEIGVLHLKWIEPRHMQHQIRRWDKSHQGELAAAWLNGSGILVWENVFGYWNPWSAEDRATLRRMAPVWRHFADHFAQGNWLPYFPTSARDTYAACWERNGTRLWTIVRPQGDAPGSVVLEIDDRGEAYFDLWRGVPIQAQDTGGRIRLEVPLTRFSAVATSPRGTSDRSLHMLVASQREEAMRRVPTPQEDAWIRATSVVDPHPASVLKARGDSVDPGMLAVDGGRFTFTLRHMRRECGCYPDPGTPPEKWDAFLIGTPHDQPLEHRVSADLASCRVDATPVTNARFEEFLIDSGYRPNVPDRFLKHWGGDVCPAELRDRPVVYIDVEDARAYAAWAGKRLPSEWEWHRGATQHGEAFRRGEVWEWTESVRDDGHTRFIMLRGGCRWQAEGSVWYFPTGPQPIDTHAKFLLLAPGLDRCATIGFRCAL